MKFLSHLRSLMLPLVAVCGVAAIATSLVAQSLPSRAILELKACGDLQVFEDGTVVESRDGRKTERRLSESRMRKLRQVIDGAPCAKDWRRIAVAPPDLNTKARVTFRTNSTEDDCNVGWMSYPRGLVEVQVTFHYPEQKIGPLPVYIVCERAKQSVKEQVKRDQQRVIKRNWQRFLKDVASATDSKRILKDCKCQ